MVENHLHVKDITKKFGNFTALKDVSLSVEKGEFMCLLGPSGCGKTTLLRIIAGLEDPNAGRVFLQGRDVTALPPAKRNFGIVFQSYALFPNLTAFDNVAYGLRARKFSSAEIGEKVLEVLEMVSLSSLGDKYPSQLSGGQQQRIALARAIALSPEFLLLDEPLSALDAKVRVMLRSEIRKLQKRLGITTIMVTHDQEEALTMADRIAVMNDASVVQVGTPQEIYEKPASLFVADFIGSINLLDRRDGKAAIRPENIEILDREDPESMKALVKGVEFRGSFYRLSLQVALGRGILFVDIPSRRMSDFAISEGKVLFIGIPKDHIIGNMIA